MLLPPVRNCYIHHEISNTTSAFKWQVPDENACYLFRQFQTLLARSNQGHCQGKCLFFIPTISKGIYSWLGLNLFLLPDRCWGLFPRMVDGAALSFCAFPGGKRMK